MDSKHASLISKIESTCDEEETEALRDELERWRETSPSLLLRRKQISMYRYLSSEGNDSGNMFALAPHQKMLQNLMAPDTKVFSLLLFHQTGVGKTCAALSIWNNFRTLPSFRGGVLLAPKHLHSNFMSQMYDPLRGDAQCLGESLLREIPDSSLLSPSERKAKVQRLVRKNYLQASTYLEFTNRLEAMRDSAPNPEMYCKRLKQKYSNMVFVVDEVHNIRRGIKDDNSLRFLQDVLSNALNVRLILLSATPMFDDPQELLFIMNVIRSNEKLPLLEGVVGDLIPEIRDFASKHVSFVRGENPSLFPQRLSPSQSGLSVMSSFPGTDMYGAPIPEEDRIRHVEIIGHQMTSTQKDIYNSIRGKDYSLTGNNDDDADEESSGSMQLAMQVQNIVFDSKLNAKMFGMEQFLSRFKLTGSNPITVSSKKDVDVKDFSPKIKYIVDSCKASTGIVFVYSQFTWAGVYPLAIALEQAGFSSITTNMLEGSSGSKGYYGMITSKTTPSDQERIIREAVSSENVRGEKLKVIIGTSVLTEGLDFKNIREIHIMDPWHNMSRVEQTIGRAIRNKSHHSLPVAERNSTVFYHASVDSGADVETLDIRMYRAAERKQLAISALERELKAHAIDCRLNRENNVPKSTGKVTHVSSRSKNVVLSGVPEDFSRQCDYMSCTYSCSQGPLDPENSDTFHFSSHMRQGIEEYKTIIKDMYQSDVVYSFDDIQDTARESFGSFSGDSFKLALTELIESREPFERMDVLGHLIYIKGRYLFQPEHVYDTKLTVGERAMVRKQGKTEVDLSSVGAVVVSGDSGSSGVEASYSELYAFLEKNAVVSPDADVLRDMILNTLSHDELRSFFAFVLSGEGVGSWRDAAERCLLLVKGKCFDYVDNVWYEMQEGSKLEILPVEETSSLYDVMRASLETSNNDSIPFVYYSLLKGTGKFYIFKRLAELTTNFVGSVCEPNEMEVIKSKVSEVSNGAVHSSGSRDLYCKLLQYYTIKNYSRRIMYLVESLHKQKRLMI